jgi:hypothetical protein
MFVRVYDKPNSRYYKSLVYGTIGEGWFLQYIVLNPMDNCFELVDYLDKSKEPAQPLVEIIQRNNDDFKVYENALLLKYKHYCKKNGKSMISKGYGAIRMFVKTLILLLILMKTNLFQRQNIQFNFANYRTKTNGTTSRHKRILMSL